MRVYGGYVTIDLMLMLSGCLVDLRFDQRICGAWSGGGEKYLTKCVENIDDLHNMQFKALIIKYAVISAL